MCLVLLVLDHLPNLSSCMVLVLSCSNTLVLPSAFLFTTVSWCCICQSKNNLLHTKKFIALPITTRSVSVELLVLIFCFRDIDIRALLPMIMAAPVWLRMSSCTAKVASTLHVKIPVSSRPISNDRWILLYKYLITLDIFL